MGSRGNDERSIGRREALRWLTAAAALTTACGQSSSGAVDGAGALARADGGGTAADGGDDLTTAADALAGQDAENDVGVARCTPTAPDALGPFHEPGAPFRTLIAAADEPGERVLMSGRVLGDDCQSPLADAIVDVWHADAQGAYHSATTNYRLRGQIKCDAQGRYQFETIRPGHYDGRPRHYHLIVTRPGYAPLTTQVYFAGDPLLGPNDSCPPPTCNSADAGRVVALQSQTVQGRALLTGAFDVVLAKA